LTSAKLLQERGYALAYDKIGLPESDEEFVDFVKTPVKLERSIDGLGALRTIKLLEISL